MARCAFCEKSFGPKGFARHITTCPKKAEFIQASAAQALATHNTEIAAAAELAQTQALLGSQNLDEAPPEIARSPSPLPPRPSGRPARRHRLPARYRDELPEPPTPLPPPPVFIPEPDPEPVPETRTSSPPKWVQTEPNAFGVYRVFPKRPTHDPEDSICLDDLCRSSTLSTAEPPPLAPFPDSPSTAPWFPFLNAT
ncbi:hypothetical protein B0H14DRAFT_3443686 [Mycena olivaceomarginata]|nr:hypothetical protein B0H14DRAFT_3443686 [Mycena olivaceomarginata]